MKKTIVIGLCIMLIGVFLTGYGYIKNGAKLLYLDGWKPQILMQIEKKQVLSKNTSFKKINIKDNTNDIVITRGAHYQVSYQGIKGYQPSVSISDGSLNIQQKKSLNNYVSISNIVENGEKIVITVPKKVILQDISANLAEGDLNIQNIKAQKIGVKNTDGDTNIANLTADRLKIASENGDVDITAQSQLTAGIFSLENGDLTDHESTFNNVTMTNSNGDIDLLGSTINGGQLKLTAGDFEGTKIGVTGNLSINNSDGDNTISLLDSSNTGYSMVNGDGDNTLFGKDVGSQVIKGKKKLTQIKLSNISGDNEIK